MNVPSNAPSAGRSLSCGRFVLPLLRPLVMGVLNVTPDSFSDGGRFHDPQRALAHAHQLIADGADILDIGGESTRPGSPTVPADQEFERISPVLEGLRDCGRPLSVDTRKPAVMRLALAAGADLINDVAGFDSEESIEAVRRSSCALCVMHMLGEPSTMQHAPVYRDVVSQVRQFLYGRVQALTSAGVSLDRIVLDPGIGFGKTQPQNLLLLQSLTTLAVSDLPVLVGLSRKSLIGHLTGKPADQRLAGSVAGALAAVARGAAIVRVHDVAATRDALLVWAAIMNQQHNILSQG